MAGSDPGSHPLTSLADDVAHTRRILNDFANGVDPVRARVLYAVQGRVSESLFTKDHGGGLAVETILVCRLAAGPISPELQRFLANRMTATTVEIDSGHLSLISHPDEVTQLILDAAQHHA